MSHSVENRLSRWHEAVSRIPVSAILPIGLGNDHNRANIAAFYGDQQIRSAVGKVLRDRGSSSNGLEWLTQVSGQAVSNDLFASVFQDILPAHCNAELMKLLRTQIHDAGTMVEAAVDAVKEQEEVVLELASWLVDTSVSLGDRNSKGRLLSLGGSITTEMLDGYPDHAPSFVSIAMLDGQRAVGNGRSKTEAEQVASAELLGDGKFPPIVNRVDLPAPERNTDDDFKPFTTQLAMNLREVETQPEWWRRGAKTPKSAFHRALMAPHIFPDSVSTVKCWVRKGETTTCALLVVLGTSGQKGRSFLVHGTTKNAALKDIALVANEYIQNELLL